MKVIVIGNGMVGHKFCEKLIAKDPTGSIEIIVFGEETRPAYDRVHLSDFFSGKSPAELALASPQWYTSQNIRLILGNPVLRIDRCKKIVYPYSGSPETYDVLVLATGSSPFIPNIPGTDKQGVFVYRTIEDVEMIRHYAAKTKSAAVIGGGLLGLEAAKAMLDLGIPEIHVIEFASRLMPRQVDEKGSQMLQLQLEDLGLTIHTNTSTSAINGIDAVSALTFSCGKQITADMVIISAGITPRDEVAVKAGLVIGPRGGILVDDRLQTSDPSIFAIGECALHNRMIYGLVAPGYEMAEVVASNLTGTRRTFDGFDMSTKLKLIGIDVASFGDPFISTTETRTICFEDSVKGTYKRINISKDGRLLLGGILVGDAAAYNMLLQTAKNKMQLPEDPATLIFGQRNVSAANEDTGALGLPDDALICSCESVTKGTICKLVSENGCENVEAIRKCTKAGTGCGGCIPLVKDLVHQTMKSQGKYIRNLLCEHFPYSRQELLDLIKMKELKTFDDVIDTLGHGDGCEVCKPAVASILASLWNEMILDKGNDTAQDSNDRYLANIQKGGTYSVVPRIPGGEITPEKLITIGQIAKKYHLYTKITGGQRIDLFGAHVNDLPNIWEELIAAGFESGHAYGKALRTVKSCVGSTWCRFGLHDSVSFAIRLEERYRGLRAPHKIKSAVSGCIRECAEAQSKDFGLIATEKGWNLYVCGNGGSKPQHALLLATDLDDETCLRYIDRFLMFYIKTADPLTRTATWLRKMDGGIDYLRNVVVNDSLGIALQLEEEMQALVDNYKCEWKEVVESPELRKRFSHFVNAPEEKDPTITFEPLRDQKRAKEWK